MESDKLQMAHVKRVYDGDTIVMWNDQAFTLSEDPGDEEFTTRFGMIDAPEVANLKYGKEGEPGGDRARQYVFEAVNGKKVYMRPYFDGNGNVMRGFFKRPMVEYEVEGYGDLHLMEVASGHAIARTTAHAGPDMLETNRLAVQYQEEAARLNLGGVHALHPSEVKAINETTAFDFVQFARQAHRS